MHHIRRTSRKAFLYLTSIILLSSTPLAAFADDSDACAEAGHLSSRWATDPVTEQCVKLYDADGTFVGPAHMAPQPTPQPEPEPAESPQPLSPSPEPTAQEPAATTNMADTATATTGAATTTDTSTVTVDNDIQSTAVTGDAKIRGNESTGSATSGNATASATVVNSVHSTVGGGSGIATFTYDIDGDVTGDIVLGGSGGPINANSTVNLNGTTNIANTAALTNNVALNATTGSATVDGNESTGSATSGDANAVANVLNLINTIIAANQSFVGTINIHGNLNGDILISPEFIPQLIASNASSTVDLALSTNINDDTSIVNNVALNATTGSATVDGNESTGSATSGAATTNLTVLNLTGHEVNAANSVLVFVNVLGEWVGMIVDAPGATAAAFGDGVLSSTVNVGAQTDIANKAMITNNLDLTAQTGSATVDGNESTGSATSGNASASANIANISTSTFTLSNWFAVLYINVFGKWTGYALKDTDAGTKQLAVIPIASSEPPAVQPLGSPDVRPALAVPAIDTKQRQLIAAGATGSDTSGSDPYPAAVLASAITGDAPSMRQTLVPAASPREDPLSTILMIGGFGVAGISGAYWAVRRLFELRASRTE